MQRGALLVTQYASSVWLVVPRDPHLDFALAWHVGIEPYLFAGFPPL